MPERTPQTAVACFYCTHTLASVGSALAARPVDIREGRVVCCSSSASPKRWPLWLRARGDVEHDTVRADA